MPQEATRDIPFKILTNNRLEIEVQRLVYSFNFILNLFLSSKCNVRYSHIYPTSTKYSFLVFCFVICINMLCIHQVFFFDSVSGNDLSPFFFQFFTIINYIIYSIGITMMLILDFIHKNNYVLLILNIQTLHRNIDISKSISSFIAFNWILSVTIVCFDSMLIFMYYIAFNTYNIGLIFDNICDASCIVLDINFAIVIRIIVLLRKYLSKWIEDILVTNDDHDNEQYCLKNIENYNNILKTYDLYKRVFQGLALYHTFNAFIRTLCNVNLVLYGLKVAEGKEALFRVVGLMLWIMKDIGLVIIHSFYNEKFYITVEEATTTCIEVLKNRNCPKSQERLCHNVLQINHSFSKMSACGLFYVDASLPLRLVALIAHYVFIQLQFYFLLKECF